jgi:ribosomal protein S27AE
MNQICEKEGHVFDIAKRGYYKRDGGNTDQSVEYTMLFCKRCGVTKEVISADHRKKED